MTSTVVKSFIAPASERLITSQLSKLLINGCVCLLLNNYKAKLCELNLIKNLALQNNGFAYHPYKNIKTRSFKELGLVLTSDALNGLVVFVFFKKMADASKFLNLLTNKDSTFVSFFAVILNGHLVNFKNYNLFAESHFQLLINSSYNLNSTVSYNLTFHFFFFIKIIQSVLNAHIKSVSKGV